MNRSTLLPIILLAVISLAVQLPNVRADISYTGNVSPTDLTDWDKTKDGYIGKTSAGTLSIEGGSSISSRKGYIGYDMDVNGSVVVSGENSSWLCGNWGELYLNYIMHVGYSGNGTLSIAEGGYVTVFGVSYIGENSTSSGTVTVSGSGSLWRNRADLYVGNSGNGTLSISDGGAVRSSSSYIGYNGTSTGMVSVSGADSKWEPTNTLYVGYSGSGTLKITDGYVDNGEAEKGYIGYNSGSSGVVEVDGGTFVWANDVQGAPSLHIGYSGNGTLSITRGGIASLGEADWFSGESTVYVGHDSGSTGRITVDGLGSRLEIKGPADFYVGYSGVASLSITDGGILDGNAIAGNMIHNPLACIGYNIGSSGSVVVDGNGSTWNTGRCVIGMYGNGTLDIVNGGSVENYSTSIGDYGGTGFVTVSGNGSKLTSDTGCFDIGRLGNGTLCVTNGGTVETDSGYSYGDRSVIGIQNEGTGVVTVSGKGSTWINKRMLLVSGNGTLNILDGGCVSVFSDIEYRPADSFIGGNSMGLAMVDGVESTWNNGDNLVVGYRERGRLFITNGGAVNNNIGCLGDGGGDGTVVVDGATSTWTNRNDLIFGFYSGRGILHISGGGEVTANNVSINDSSVLAIDVGNNSVLSVGGGTITNDGEVRILAGAGVVADGTPFSPIAATTWDGDGVYRAVGGTWNETTHQFTVSNVISGNAGDTLSLDLSEIQRALVVDGGIGKTGWAVGASFLHKTGENTDLDLIASVITGDTLELLKDNLEEGQKVKGAWNFTATGDGYYANDPIYLSFFVGEGYNRNDLQVWRFSGYEWTMFEPMDRYWFDAIDLTYNDGWASFTIVTGPGRSYAVSAVPEPGTLVLLLVAGLGLLIWGRGNRRSR